MASRRAFTLLELLVVISVIAVLAGLLIPTIGLVRRLVNDVKCGNNLQQIASAIESYKSENTDQWPNHMIGDQSLAGTAASLADTSNLVNNGGPLTGLAKVFLCPRDVAMGSDHTMGRGQCDASPGELAGLWDSGTINNVVMGSSYCFEASGYLMGQTGTPPYSWFYTSADIANFTSTPTCWMGKNNELQFGMASTDGTTYRGKLPPSQFPAIRCFWHAKWLKVNLANLKKVVNVSFDLNVFSSIPEWENAIYGSTD
jgi:prepilin-type N-terminal cleavage/methylation domain-containing protein